MIELKDVSYGWNSDQVLQNNLDLCLEPRNVYVILGTNGCGKSSFFNLFADPQMFRTGKIYIDGTNLDDLSSAQRAQKIIAIGQNTGWGHDMKVLDYLLTAYYPYMGLFSSPGRREMEEVRSILKTYKISDWTDRTISTLSGGEFIRVQMARCHTGSRKYILMDEADRALDYYNQILFMETVLHLRKEGKCVVIISHNPNLALYLQCYVLLLGKGCNYKYGPASEIVTKENLQLFYGIDVVDTYSEELNIHQFAPKISSSLLDK